MTWENVVPIVLQVLLAASVLSIVFLPNEYKYRIAAVFIIVLAVLQIPTFGIVYAVYVFMNIVVFIIFATDKSIAEENGKHHSNKERVPENKLLVFAVFGILGAIAAIIAMHHKVNKLKFQIGIPLILGIELFALDYFGPYLFG